MSCHASTLNLWKSLRKKKKKAKKKKKEKKKKKQDNVKSNYIGGRGNFKPGAN